ncbi:MAG TPA: Pycsar system effector family protein [Gammaproteobacteria bacterium]|nr:Pycsar system effector family protein [Gammaproteobacteria bacterium]
MTQQISSSSGSEPASPEPGAPSAAVIEAVVGEPKKDKKKKKKSDVSRGVETMFRVTYMNHIALSQLADNKANMLISVNGFIISVGIAVLTPRLGSISWMFAPALVLIAGCMISLAFAIIGSRPRLNRTQVTVEQIRNNESNVLFFGQFMSMPLRDFQESINALMNDPHLLYDNLIRQLYSMGQSLLRKYQFVQIAYTVFLTSTGLATALFIAILLTVGFER